MTLLEIVSGLCIGLGTFIILVGAFGVLRFPDFYTRLHAAGKGDTLGQALVLLGLLLLADATPDIVKLLAIMAFVFILNPTATHALARAAWLSGMRPWRLRDGEPVVQHEDQMQPGERADVMLPVPAAPTDDELVARAKRKRNSPRGRSASEDTPVGGGEETAT